MQQEITEQNTNKIAARVKAAAQNLNRNVTEGLSSLADAAKTAISEAPAEDDTLVELEPNGTMPWRPELFGATRRGKVRDQNEDQFLLAELERSARVLGASQNVGTDDRLLGTPQGWVAIVADGVGGKEGGILASQIAVETMAHHAFTMMPWSFNDAKDSQARLAKSLQQAVDRCQQNVERVADEAKLEAPPASTLTAAYIAWPNLYIAHVGDSRGYLLRNDELHRLTSDHTFAADAAQFGVEVRPGLQNVLLNVVGGDSHEVRAELRHVVLNSNDTLLLCTDGVTKHVDDESIERQLKHLRDGSTRTTELAVHGLLAEAVEDGGTDNATAVIVAF